MKAYIVIFICFFATSLSFSQPTQLLIDSPNDKLAWKIDNNVKFSYAYLENSELLRSFKENENALCEFPKPVSFSPYLKPDITNISLVGILGLGFPLPTTPEKEKYNCYLKLHEYPQYLNAKASSDHVMADYLLDKAPGADILRHNINNPENINIKQIVIAESGRKYGENDPFPYLVLPKETISFSQYSVPVQTIFDSSIPFLSLYLLPSTPKPIHATPEDQANWSVKGMVSFYSQLLTVYQQNLIEISGADSNFYYFAQPQYLIPKSSQISQFKVLRLPKQPMIFNNFFDLPMPHGSNFFLSGLLLVYKTDYTSIQPWQELLQKPNWQEFSTATSTQILEIGSVVEVEVK